MIAEHTQIIKAYEELNLGPSDIALERDLPIVEVKMVLMQFCSKYRKDTGADKENKLQLDFTDEQLERANQTIYQIMESSEDENLRSRMAKYIRDDKKGRKDALRNIKKLNINVSQFNHITMQNALRSLEASKSISQEAPSESNVLDVQEVEHKSA